MAGLRVAAWLLVVSLASNAALAAPRYIWVEAEKPASANFDYQVQTWSPLLSDGKWLHFAIPKERAATAIPPGGLQLSYHVDAERAGAYELWLRLGFESVRAPLQWRINGGEWHPFGPRAPTTNLLELGEWAEVAWGKLGVVQLNEGRSTIELRCTEPGRDGRLIIALDCLALVEGERNFTPEMAMRPGETYEGKDDVAAAQQVFRFPSPLPAPAERIELALDGLWQVARYDDPDMSIDTYEPVSALPAPGEYRLRWMGIRVPGDARARPELRFGHRLLHRTRVDVPKELAGRAFHLHFSGTNWIASVLVNGEYIGGHQSVLVPWDMDITRALRPGRVNTVTIGIKSSWYALQPGKGETVNDLRNRPYSGEFKKNYRFVDAIYPSTKGEGNGLAVGIVRPVKLVVTGPAYTSDIFIRPSVSKRRLDADVTVTNAAASEARLSVLCEAVDEKTGEVAKAFGPVDVTVGPGGRKLVQLGGPWENPKLWWPEDEPNLYVMRTTIKRDGKPIDIREDLFGFREVSISGKDFLLNGVPWHFWNWVGIHADTPEEWLARYHAQNDRFHRISADSDGRLWGYREKALEFFDRHGIPGRLSTCIDGMFITHDLRNPLVWENFKNHVRQVVTAYRNHPSIMMWSLGNELIFITSRLAYNAEDNLTWMAKAQELSDLAKELDPTRASFQDGGGDLNRAGEINCQHYTLPRGASVPGGCYAYRLREGTWNPTGTWDRSMEQYAWDGKRPLVLGEVFYYAGNPSAMAWIGGPDVYRGKTYADRAAAVYARIAIEGARWQGVTAICPWVGPLPDALVSFEPRAAFVREYNSCFYPGATMRRTIKVFNDTHSSDPLTLKWRVMLDGRQVAAGEKTYRVPPGRAAQDTLSARLPRAERRLDGRLELELYAGDRRVFTDSKPVSVLPTGGAVAGLSPKELSVFDPAGRVRSWLESNGLGYTPFDPASGLPENARVLLVGPAAINKENKAAVARALKAAVEAGKTAIVLEQDEPLAGEDLPVTGIRVAGERPDRPPRPEFRAAGGQSGRIAFPVAPAHPVLAGLKASDFFTWADDETTFRLSYATPSSGAIALVQAGNELRLTPMLELPVRQGSCLLSQMLIGARLGTEPVADRLLHNILAWAAGRARAKPGKTLACLAGDAKLKALLDAIGLDYSEASGVEQALSRGADVIVVRATPQAVAELDRRRDRVRAFCRWGGHVMLVGLDAGGLAAFDRLVGFEHRLRPFRREAVALQARTDPLLLGLSDRDVSMISNQVLASWRHLYWVSERTFSSVVDGREVASFAQLGSDYLYKLTDGLTNDDFWQYICYFGTGEQPPEVTFKFDRPETFIGMKVWASGSYHYPKDIELVFDGDAAHAVPFTLEARTGAQEVKFTPRTASSVTIRIKSRYPSGSSRDLVGIDDVELFRRVPEDFDRRVILLTDPGGLVRYPIGKGSIVLNQVDYASDDTGENVKKKQGIYANLLRNMGASFGR